MKFRGRFGVVTGFLYVLFFCLSSVVWAEENEMGKEFPKEEAKSRKEIFVDKVVDV